MAPSITVQKALPKGTPKWEGYLSSQPYRWSWSTWVLTTDRQEPTNSDGQRNQTSPLGWEPQFRKSLSSQIPMNLNQFDLRVSKFSSAFGAHFCCTTTATQIKLWRYLNPQWPLKTCKCLQSSLGKPLWLLCGGPVLKPTNHKPVLQVKFDFVHDKLPQTCWCPSLVLTYVLKSNK